MTSAYSSVRLPLVHLFKVTSEGTIAVGMRSNDIAIDMSRLQYIARSILNLQNWRVLVLILNVSVIITALLQNDSNYCSGLTLKPFMRVMHW